MRPELLLGSSELILRAAGAPPLRESVMDVRTELADAARRLVGGRCVPVRLAVACSHVRLFLVPWVAQLTTEQRWQSMAAGRFEQIYSEPSDGWIVRIAEELPPRARLAAALPAWLLEALQAICARDGARPAGRAGTRASVHVWALEAIGRLLERDGRFHGCVVEVSGDHAALFVFRRGELLRIRSRRFDRIDDIAGAVRLEWAALSEPGPAHRRPARPPGRDADPIVLAMLGVGVQQAAPLAQALGAARILELH